MKKNLLFVMPSLNAGGGEKSLINLLSQIDYNSYNVDLFLFNKTGVFFNSIPDEVNILETPPIYRTFTKNFSGAINSFIKSGDIHLAFARILFTTKNRIIKNKDFAEQYSWKYVSRSLKEFKKEYDAAIGFLEKSSIYFIVDNVKAKKKIGWIHTNYSCSGMNPKFDKVYFQKLDHIVTVSEECVKSLKKSFPAIAHKIELIYNIVSPRLIKMLADEVELFGNPIFEKTHINILTIGRLSYEKGIDLAINSCKELLNRGYKIKWYVMGEGSERTNLENLIKNFNLQNNFILLGTKENPYPYLKQADIYVQPSRYEGKSIAIDEAKILNKPIVVTKFESSKDQINNELDGLIVGISYKDIVEGVERLVKNCDLSNYLISNLETQKLSTEHEIEKLYKIIN
jgi:glycosyltransferase involved in cell wall biosynthesis